MKKNPNEILSGKLDCVLMANGELIAGGKTLGWFDTLGKYFTPVAHVDGTPVKDGEYE